MMSKATDIMDTSSDGEAALKDDQDTIISEDEVADKTNGKPNQFVDTIFRQICTNTNPVYDCSRLIE